ncbi:hypothetical protein Hanom_Chr10g00944971 [Helianthus anomalus]
MPNPSRFVDGERIVRADEKQWKPINKEDPRVQVDNDHQGRVEDVVDLEPGNARPVVGNRSFRDTLLNKEVEQEVTEIIVDDKVLALGEYSDTGLVARVKTFLMLSDLKNILKEMMDVDIEINYIGGLNVLLVFRGNFEKSVFLEDKEMWMKSFVSVECWKGQIVDFERIAWLKIFGIPLHLSCKEVMDSVAATVGEIFQSNEFLEGGKDLSYGCWKDSKFEVVIEEDVGEWCPECLYNLQEDDNCVLVDDVVLEEEDVCMVEDSGNEVGNEDNQTRVEFVETPQDNSGLGDIDGNIEVAKEVIKHKKKGRKAFRRRRSIGSRNGSPSGQERPKKRCRDGR